MKKPGWLDEFKVFISRGNVIDLAVGVVVGGAFTAIVTALVAGMSNDHTSFIGFAVIPLLSFGLLLFEANRTGLSWSDLTQKPKEELAVENANADNPSARSTSQRDAEEEPGAKFGVGKLMFSIMTFSFLCRLFDAIPAYDDPFAFVGGSAIFGLIVVGVVFLVIVAKLRERFNAALTYRLSLPIMVADSSPLRCSSTRTPPCPSC